MPKSYWLVVKSPENFDIARDRGFDMVGLKVQHRRKVQRMEPEDRVLIYISQKRRFGATATVTSSMKEDHTPIWKDEIGNDFPFRVSIKPDIVLDESQQIDAYQKRAHRPSSGVDPTCPIIPEKKMAGHTFLASTRAFPSWRETPCLFIREWSENLCVEESREILRSTLG